MKKAVFAILVALLLCGCCMSLIDAQMIRLQPQFGRGSDTLVCHAEGADIVILRSVLKEEVAKSDLKEKSLYLGAIQKQMANVKEVVEGLDQEYYDDLETFVIPAILERGACIVIDMHSGRECAKIYKRSLDSARAGCEYCLPDGKSFYSVCIGIF